MSDSQNMTAFQRYAQGSAAFNAGKSLSANPFLDQTAWEWSEGWLHAQKAQGARENGAITTSEGAHMTSERTIKTQ